MKKKYKLILILLILLATITIFYSRKSIKLNRYKNESLLMNNVKFNDKHINVIERTSLENSGLSKGTIFIDNGISETPVADLLPAGYNATKIVDSFIFNEKDADYLVFISSWDSENKTLDISGIFYDILIFNENLERLTELEDQFFDYSSEAAINNTNFLRSKKDLVLKKLREIESEGKL